MRTLALALIVTTGCIFRGGAVATRRPNGGAGVDGTVTAAFGGKGSRGPGAAFGATATAGYDSHFGAVAAGWGPSFEYFSPGQSWILYSMLTCGGRFVGARIDGDVVASATCEVRVGPSHLVSHTGDTANWAGLDLVLGYSFAGTTSAVEGFTIGLAATWEHWLTYIPVR
jgi:hypothetical protein